jgi:hypothetical protein
MNLISEKFSLKTVIGLTIFFQLIHFSSFFWVPEENARSINNIMIGLICSLYFISVVCKRSVMNRFQTFITIITLFALRNLGDDSLYINYVYLGLFILYNFISAYDIFVVKKDFGEHILDFVLMKNWF